MPTQRPPDVPPGVDPQVAQYLRKLATWAYQEIDAKIPKDEATPNLILAAYDQKQNPNIFRIEVSSSGALQSVQVPLGGGKP